MTNTKNLWNDENPWLGLRAYSEGQLLFGRDKETTALSDIILNHTASVVYGKSGIGKSSLLRAGVFPLLRSNGFAPIYLRLAHNTEVSYSQQIKDAITDSLNTSDLLPNDIPDMGLWDFLHRHRFTDTDGNAVTPVVVLDQFEEIFTLTDVAHKPAVQELFTELADVLNDVKPDRVIEAETAYIHKHGNLSSATSTQGFTLQSFSKSELHYLKSPSFRFVFSLRDDSLYLLERISAKIPAIKVNRYNLCALDEKSALEVILKPRVGLFSDADAREILNGLAYYEYDDFRVVDPAILSLFLFSYYKEQGQVSYENIFEKYYRESIQPVSDSSIAYLEEELLTDEGYRKRLPYKQLLGQGISMSELKHLEKCIILKKEKDYVEFSHDLLCKEALKHKNQKAEEKNRKRIKMLLGTFLTILVLFVAGAWLMWPKPPIEMVTLKLQFTEDSAFMSREHWEASFRFLDEKDSLLQLSVQTLRGTPMENLRAKKGSRNLFLITMPKDYVTKGKKIKIELYDCMENCRSRKDTVDVRQWESNVVWKIPVERIQKVLFTGKVVNSEGNPIAKAMVILGNQPMQETDSNGSFSFFLEDSSYIKNDLYVFKQGYDAEHFLGELLAACQRGDYNNPLLVSMNSSDTKQSDIDFKQLFAEQLHASVSLYRLAQYNYRNGSELSQEDSVRLDSVIKVYPDYALNMKKLRRTNKMTSDGKIDVYCVSIENPQVDGLRDVLGNYLQDGKDHVFKGKMMRVRTDDKTCWRLSAIAWDKENNQFIIQGILNRVNEKDKKSFTLEVLKPYQP